MKQKKINLFAVLFAVSFLILFPFVVEAINTHNNVPDKSMQENSEEQTPSFSVPEDEGIQDKQPSKKEDSTSPLAQNQQKPTTGESSPESTEENSPSQGAMDFSYFDDALFIGDSRTMGISEYGTITNADFFADTGMSVYNVQTAQISVPSVGKVTLEELLQSKAYGKIYIMLGINELGYEFTSTVDKYQELISQVQEMQPEAIIYIEGNLHVTRSRSDSDPTFNNTAIDRFNQAIAAFANGQDIFYLNINELFDDEDGNLRADYSSDNTHILGKYYPLWCDWLLEKAVAQG